MEKAISCYKKFADTFEHAREVFANAIQNELLQGLWFDAVCVPYMEGRLAIYVLNTNGDGEKEKKELLHRLKTTGDEEMAHDIIMVVYNLRYTAKYFPDYARIVIDEEAEEEAYYSGKPLETVLAQRQLEKNKKSGLI